MDPKKGELLIVAGKYDDVYQEVVHPDRALYISGYFKRWLQYLGPDLAWMYCSFRQAAYLDGGRSDAFTSRFSVAELAARAGITDRTFWNRAGNKKTWEKLNGLVTRADESAEWDKKSGMPKQLSRKFEVAMTLPLVPKDTTSLRKWLISNKDQYGGEEDVLRAAATVALDELLPTNAEHEDSHDPITVRRLVHDLFGELDPKLLDALASAIQNNIMPSNDQLKITIFFLEHVLPHMGAGPAWVITLLRDKCFSNDKITRNRVTVEGGYAEITNWLGTYRIKTTWEWLNQKKGGMYVNPVFRLYIKEALKPERERNFERQSRTFQLLLEEIPREMLEAHLTEKGMIAELLPNGGNFSHVMARFTTPEQRGATFSLGMADFSVVNGAIFSHAMAQFSEEIGATFRVKNLSSLNPTLKFPPTQFPHPDENTEQEPTIVEPERELEAGGQAGWSFNSISRNNTINSKSRKQLCSAIQDEQVLSRSFLAWILYAFSPQGRGLTDLTGVSKAIKSLCSADPESAPQKFERLVKLGPQKLQDLFDRDYARDELGESPEANIYRANFEKLDPVRKSDLYFRLFGADSPEPATQPKKRERPPTKLEMHLEQVRLERAGAKESSEKG